ncbi:hypothetical protein AAFN85_03315 [Mucilaginibacter sp. CAU 1740]|uniref:hypothetical protein n=1 Tax=Mucilaginibacter sp. CAU 1740 TaxID=3140365 RepID=UPI00325AB756
MSLSELFHLHIWARNIPPVTYLNGMILFVTGLAILRIHNLWSRRWPLLLTLLAWGALLGGLSRIFFPAAKQAGESVYTYVFISLLLLTGLYLSYQGYRKK